MPIEKQYRYPFHEIMKDIIRAGAGITLTAYPLLLLKPSSVIVFILGSLLCLFVLYGVRAFDRKFARICISPEEIRINGIWKRAIKWEALEQISLSYFSTRRDREKGWMQLRLKGRGVRLRVESTIAGFEDLVEICVAVALKNKLSLDVATKNNLEILGLSASSETFQTRQLWGKE